MTQVTRVTAASTGRALHGHFPEDDVRVARDFGGVPASVFHEGGGASHFSIGDQPGMLTRLSGINGTGPNGDGGESADARLSA